MRTSRTILAFAAYAGVAAASDMPIREVTVFKDGHAFVEHAGTVAVNPAGEAELDGLPMPVLGTFWPFSADRSVPLVSVTAGKHVVGKPHAALSIRELIAANVGGSVLIKEVNAASNYPATVLEIPKEEGTGSVSSSYVLLKTEGGVKAVSWQRIEGVTFPGSHRTVLTNDDYQGILTLRLDCRNLPASRQVQVGMIYLQKGLRWIPNYRVSLDGKGSASVKLQGTIINELADLSNVTMHLVVGVPTFAFKDTLDPMGLQQAVAQLSPHFRPDAQTAYGFHNAIMSQVAMPYDRGYEPPVSGGVSEALGPEIAGSGPREDLFVFTVEHVTLRKGDRMVVPVAEFTVPYTDVYSLAIPVAPPTYAWRSFDASRQNEVARQMRAAKVIHKIRLKNTSAMPFTTAPALLMNDNAIVAQGMMTYTPAGGAADVTLTTAVDINVRKTDTETTRVANALNWNGCTLARIDLTGTLRLVNLGKKPVEVEVKRYLIGSVDEASGSNDVAKLEQIEDAEWCTDDRPEGWQPWWYWYSWPWWCWHVNSVSSIRWTVTLAPGKPSELAYAWHYFWD